MGLVLLLLILALIFGGIGFVLEAAGWVFVIALVLFGAGLVAGFVSRGRSRA